MKSVIQISLLIIVMTNFTLLSQPKEKNFSGSSALASELSNPALSPSDVNLTYELELFPGRVFNGRYYYWSNGSTATANLQITPSGSWLRISPNTFTSTSCSDIVFIEYYFTAPQLPGTYTTSVHDLNGNWADTDVTLTVTETPASAQILSYQVNYGQTISKLDTLHWNGFGPFGCQNNYIPGNDKTFNFTQRDSVSWFSMSPSNITVPLFGEGIVESFITGDTTGNNFVYVIEEAQYASRCFYFRVELNVLTDVENSVTSNIPEEFILEQNYPNPFNPSTKIKYSVPELSFTTLKVYDVLGNEVATLVDEYLPAGSYETDFNAKGLASGMYLYRLQAGSFVETKKMILLR